MKHTTHTQPSFLSALCLCLLCLFCHLTTALVTLDTIRELGARTDECRALVEGVDVVRGRARGAGQVILRENAGGVEKVRGAFVLSFPSSFLIGGVFMFLGWVAW